MVNFSVELPVNCPVTKLASYLSGLDGCGFYRVWVPDAPFAQWELWSAATVAVVSTSQTRVGVTSPYHRSPAVIAHGIHTYSTNERLLQTAREWAKRSPRPGFTIVTTVAYIDSEEARDRWLDNMSHSQGLLSLMGMGPGEEGRAELNPQQWEGPEAKS